jgi:hypothetical protein
LGLQVVHESRSVAASEEPEPVPILLAGYAMFWNSWFVHRFSTEASSRTAAPQSSKHVALVNVVLAMDI